MSKDKRSHRRLQAKYKRLINELGFLYSDLDYHAEEHEYRKKEFNDEFFKFCEENGYDCSRRETFETFEKKQTDVYNQKVTKQEAKEIKEEVEQDLGDETTPSDSQKDIKTLYRKIAIETHPDKISESELEAIKKKKNKLFREAKAAMDDKNFFKLTQIASELGVELPEPTKQQLVWMEEEKKKIQKTLSGIQKTYEWVCAEESPPQPKEIMFQQYAETIGCVKLQKES